MGRVRVVIVAVVGLTLVASPMASAKPPSATEQNIANELFDRINAARNNKGMGVLARVNFIDHQAYKHSKRMARKRRLTHAGLQKRFKAIQNNDADVTHLCENVAFASGYPAKRIHKVFFKGWRRSAPHRRCMFDKLFSANEVGIGIEKRGRRYYGTFIAVRDTTP